MALTLLTMKQKYVLLSLDFGFSVDFHLLHSDKRENQNSM